MRIGKRDAARHGAGQRRNALDLDQVLGRIDADRRLTLVVAQDELHLAALNAAALVDVLDRELRAVRDALADRSHGAGKRQDAAELHGAWAPSALGRGERLARPRPASSRRQS